MRSHAWKRTVLLARISPSVPTVIDIDDEGEGGKREESQEESDQSRERYAAGEIQSKFRINSEQKPFSSTPISLSTANLGFAPTFFHMENDEGEEIEGAVLNGLTENL